MVVIIKSNVWTPELVDELKELWVKHRDWRKVSKVMGIPFNRCMAAYFSHVKAEDRILREKKYWTDERLRDFCHMWANEPDLQKLNDKFPGKDILIFRRKARKLKVERLSGIIPEEFR